MSIKRDLCRCGGEKDHRAEMCRKCKDIEKSNRPCCRCKRQLPLSAYYSRPKANGGLKRRGHCKECEQKEGKQYRQKYPERVRQTKRNWKENNLETYNRGIMRRGWRKLGLDPDHVEMIYKNHNGTCDICGEIPKPSGRYNRLSADHCHKTNVFRGFLCHKCNAAIGLFQDEPNLLQRAIEYLKNRETGV